MTGSSERRVVSWPSELVRPAWLATTGGALAHEGAGSRLDDLATTRVITKTGRAMNDLALGLRRRVDLATEPPFDLGRLRVTPALLQVSGGGTVEQLEPKVMQVLVLLRRARGEAISRAQLTEVCWGNVVVGDDSINRSISLARRALRADPAVCLQTIPRVGYRLYVDAEPATEEGASISPRPSVRKQVLLLGAAACIVVAAAVWVWQPFQRAMVVSGVRPLTRQGGVEMFPAVSPDGTRVAFAMGAGFGAPRDVVVRGVEVGVSSSVTVAGTSADEFAPAWSPNGSRLAFVRRSEGRCEIVVKAMPNGADGVVGTCRAAPDGLTWLGDDKVVFGDRPQPGPRRLIAIDVGSGWTRPMTNPAANAQGDGAPVASPNGRDLLFRRTAALGSDDLYVLDVRSGVERRLTRDGWKAIGAAWSADGRTIFFSSNREGDFGVWSISAKGGEPHRVSPGLMPIGRISAPSDGRYLVAETTRQRSTLFRVSDASAPTAVSAPAGNDWDPDVGADGAMVFASDRSGANELWLTPANQAPRRLTRLGASYVHSPRLSLDGDERDSLAVQ